MDQPPDLKLLQLLHFSDSALPIGTAAHSFGLEALVADDCVTVASFESFLRGWLTETGAMDAWFCRKAHEAPDDWFALNEELSAARLARKSREASLTLGRRLLALARRLTGDPAHTEGHHALAFGLIGRTLELDASQVVAACLHQNLAAMIFAAQRLLPIGQFAAAQLLWDLKPQIASIAEHATTEWQCFTPSLDLASFRHPSLETRLFIS